MGWTGTMATHYKENGKIDRKAECDAYFEEGLNRGNFKVLKSAMVGSVYYAAVKNLVKCIGNNEEGRGVYVPIDNGRVWGAVFLTSVEKGEFYYKDMSEDVGPAESKCPVSIINLLSETDDEFALNWRERCRENAKSAKNPQALKNLPVGTVIRFALNGKDYEVVKMAPNHQFKRSWWLVHDSHTYIPAARILKDYTVVEV